LMEEPLVWGAMMAMSIVKTAGTSTEPINGAS